MIAFVIIAVGMTFAAVACVVLPLLRDRKAQGFVDTRQSNLAVLRDQLAELKADLARGTIQNSQFDAAHAELEARVLEEASTGEDAARRRQNSPRSIALAFVVAIPIAAAAGYWWIGQPGGMDPAQVARADNLSTADVQNMVKRLAERLEKTPDDAQGWMLLGRSYYVLQRMDEAAAAYARAVERVRDDADLFADYADALAMSQGRNLEGKPMQMVRRALAINPMQPKALAMAGTEAFQRKDYRASIAHWEKLLALLPADSEIARSIAEGISEAKAQLADASGSVRADQSKSPASPARNSSASVSGSVTIDPALAGKASPRDTLFVIARASSGPRIPLAVLKRWVSDLPLEFSLDDSLSMSPEFKLSGAGEVVVTARISKSGNALPQSGDLQGAAASAKVGARGLRIVIDSVVP